MEKVTERANAKINLSLYITGRKHDGYHLLSSVMQTIDLYDEITVLRISPEDSSDGSSSNNLQDVNTPQIILESDNPDIPMDSGNTAYLACEEFFKHLGINQDILFGVRVIIKKNIPICAGLGGPSADAAAVLRGLNRLLKTGLPATELKEIGLRIGADVPFLVEGGLCYCEGVGEVLSPINTVCPGYILLAKPNVSVSTAWAYDAFDRAGAFLEGDGGRLERALLAGDLQEISSNLHNDFSEIVFKKYPIIRDIRDCMIRNNALGALMSGSGSTVFGIFDDKEALAACRNKIKEDFPGIQTFVTEGL